jgi:glycerol uptake facilitator-like aquaporin
MTEQHVMYSETSTETTVEKKKKKHHHITWDWRNPKGLLMSSMREGIATFLFFIISYTLVATNIYNGAYLGLFNGLAYMGLYWTFVGAVMNPMLTIGRMTFMTLRVYEGVCHIVAQIIGGLLSGLIVRFVFDLNMNFAVAYLLAGRPLWSGFFVEFFGAMIFTFVVITVEANEWKGSRAIMIGAILSAIIVMAAPISTGCFNPLKAFVASVYAFFNAECWIYYVAPIAAAIIAAIFLIISQLVKLHQKVKFSKLCKDCKALFFL